MNKHNIRRDFFSALTGLSVVLGAPVVAEAKPITPAELISILARMGEHDTVAACMENFTNGKNMRTISVSDKESGDDTDVAFSNFGGISCRYDIPPATLSADGKFVVAQGTFRVISPRKDAAIEVGLNLVLKKAVAADDRSPTFSQGKVFSRFYNAAGNVTLWRRGIVSEMLDPLTGEWKTLSSRVVYRYCTPKNCKEPSWNDPENRAVRSSNDIGIANMVVKVEAALSSIASPTIRDRLDRGVQPKAVPQMPAVTPQDTAVLAEHMPQYRHTDSVLTPEAMALCIKSAREDSQKYGASPVLISPNLTCQITGGSKESVAYEVFDLATVPGSDWNGQKIKSAQLSAVVGRQSGSSILKYIRVEGVNVSPDGERAWAVNLSAAGEAEAPAVVAYYNCPTGAMCQTRNQIWPHQMGALEAAANTHMEEIARSVLKTVKPDLVRHADLMRAWSSDVAFIAQPFMEVYPWTGMTADRPIPQPLPVFYKERTASAATFRVAAPQPSPQPAPQ